MGPPSFFFFLEWTFAGMYGPVRTLTRQESEGRSNVDTFLIQRMTLSPCVFAVLRTVLPLLSGQVPLSASSYMNNLVTVLGDIGYNVGKNLLGAPVSGSGTTAHTTALSFGCEFCWRVHILSVFVICGTCEGVCLRGEARLCEC